MLNIHHHVSYHCLISVHLFSNIYALTFTIREALLHQIGCFFVTLYKGYNCHKFKANYTYFPQIYSLFCQILSRQTFTHFLTFMSKNPQHDCVKTRGGSRAVYTMCKKTSDLAEDGFPNVGMFQFRV